MKASPKKASPGGRGRSLSRPDRPHPVLVVGGGAAGQKAALELAHAGLDVLLVERQSSLGGSMAQLGMMFPTHNCLLCRGEARHGPGCTRPTLSSELLDHARPPRLEVWTRSRVLGAEPCEGGLRVSIRREPRWVDASRCVSCDRCAQVCPQVLPDPFEAGLAPRKAAYRPSLRPVPDAYAIDKGPYCEGCGKCVSICPTRAISLEEKPRTETARFSAIVLATGLRLFDPALSREYGYGRFANVVTGLEMERMCSPAGPGEGRILRRSDGRPPQRIAWLQCVGSREKTRDYCSAFCCGYATRQAVLARRLLPSAEVRLFLMDDRVFSRSFSAVYDPLRRAYGLGLERCRLSTLQEDPATGDLLLQLSKDDGRVVEERFELVVLSVGAEGDPEARELARGLGIQTDDFGFVRTSDLNPLDTKKPGIFVAGAASGPADIADSVTLGAAAAARVCAFLGWRLSAPPARGEGRAGNGPVRSSVRRPPSRIGVLACDCAGEIGNVVDLQRVLDFAARLPGVNTVQAVPFGCLAEGMNTMRAAARGAKLEGVVIGACKRRTYGPLFEKSLGMPVRFVSLREECSAVHRDDAAGATRKAMELVRMAVEELHRAEASLLPQKIFAGSGPKPASAPSAAAPVRPVRSALVVGGGLAGMTAALHLAQAGAAVHLVERTERLGGNALRLDRTLDGSDIPAAVEALARRLRSHPGVRLHTGCEVVRRGGHAGDFTVVLRPWGAAAPETHLRVGAIVAATGAEEYRGPVYGLGSDPRVLTLLDLGRRLRRQPELPRRMSCLAFIGCAGPWDEPESVQGWRCSRGCCETMMRQALAVKRANPDCRVAMLVREVNTYGLREELYTAARRAGILFVRFQPSKRPYLKTSSEALELSVLDANLGELLVFQPDLVALAAAVIPREDSARTAASLDLPLAVDGFFRPWEAKTRPFASLEPGVFLCGLASGPRPLCEVLAQALAAAQEARGLLEQTELLPGETVASVNEARCAACLTCVRVCPYGVPRLEEGRSGRAKRRAFIDAYRCQGCGACASECPAKAIRLSRYGEEQLLDGGLLGRWLVSA